MWASWVGGRYIKGADGLQGAQKFLVAHATQVSAASSRLFIGPFERVHMSHIAYLSRA